MKKIKIVFAQFLIIGLLIPIIFTILELGIFAPEPKVEIQNKVTDPNAPVLRVVADFDFSPYSFYNKNNEVTGLDVELINEIGNRLGMKTEIIFADWQTCKLMLQEKNADLILGLEIFSHMEGVLKTVAVSEDQLVIFGREKINNISALKGKKVGLMVNSVIERLFELNCQYVEYFTNTQILEAIENGEIDFGVCHASVGKKILQNTNYNIIPSVSLMNSYPAIGVRQDLPELRDKINQIIPELSSEGLINKLDEKWLVDFTHKNTLAEVFILEYRFYMIYGILFIFSVIVFVFVYLQSYHHERKLKDSIEYQVALKKQYDILASIAEVYNTMHIIYLCDDSVQEISTNNYVKKYVQKQTGATEQMINVMKMSVIPEDVQMALGFTDLTSLQTRMADKDIILAEFRGRNLGWFCAQFIAVERDKDGVLQEVIFTTQGINEMKQEKERLLKLSAYDELSQLFNRYSYETKLEEFKKNNNLVFSIIMLDVNGLKTVNDNIGHSAGDELIIGAANTIKNSFGDIGTCYRIGGDEFVVLVENEVSNIEDIITQFKNNMENWSGNQVKKLSISSGFASAKDITDFSVDKYEDLIKLADRKMYEDKALYYKKLGIDRRR